MDREDIDVDDLAHLPPPPRGDFDFDDSDEFEDDEEDSYDDDDDDDEEEYVEEEEEEDDSSLDHRIGHRQYNQHRQQFVGSGSDFIRNNDNHFNFMDDKATRSRSTPSPSLLSKISKINCGNNDIKNLSADDDGDDENNNSMLFFGEDTMHVLMDAELRLKSIPPTPSTSSSVSFTLRSNAGVATAVTATATLPVSLSGEVHETKGQQVSTVDEAINGDDDDGLSTGAASLLRGPIMAANSASQIMHNHDNIGGKISDTSAGIWTDSGDRKMTIQTHQDVIGANLTPSMFRKHFFPHETPTPSQVRRGFVDDVVAVGSAIMKKTPGSTSSRSSVSHEFGSGGYQQRHAIHHRQQQPNNTPSLARSHFLPSPQDSVSTMGQLSPSEEYHAAVAVGPNTGAVDNLMQHHQQQYSLAGGNENKVPNSRSSIDGMIALGEKQMNQSTTVNISNQVPKKPFLRKGTRREPSALHTRINKSNPGGVGLTPSTARLQQQCISPALPKSSDGPTHSNLARKANNTTSDTIESQSAREERLARLEKMQEDLIHDLERRLSRKEEARDDRRRTKMMAKKKATSTPAGATAKRAVVTSQQKLDDEDACVTPSQMRTPATQALRQVSSTKGEERVKSSRAHTGRTKPSVADNTKTGQHEDIITPSQARRSSSPSAESIVEKYVARRNGDIVEEQNFAHQSSHGNGLENGETTKSKTKQQALRSKSMPRPRTTVRTSNLSRGAASMDVDEKKAFEDWKKKEEEQWALIKNMRKRQEAALREAEGERERVSCCFGSSLHCHVAYISCFNYLVNHQAKAWAVAEKESVQKWAKEQRAAIEKYRHKAANAALIASKESNKGKLEGSNSEELKAMKAELEELRLAMKGQKDKEKAEIKKLKEVIREQEKTIDALKSSNEGGAAKSGKTSSGPGPRPVLADGSSKLNTNQQQQQNSTSKTLRKAVGENSSKTRRGGALVDITENTLRDDDNETSSPAEAEPSDIWLQRHLSKLNDANNRLGERLADGVQHHGSMNAGDIYQFANEDNLHRKQYNAADYSGKVDDLPTQVTKNSNPTVPSFVTAPSPSRHIKFADQSRSKSKIVNYKNGTQKEVLPDGTTTISFANGDRKRTYANEKEGIVVYYYASTKVCAIAVKLLGIVRAPELT